MRGIAGISLRPPFHLAIPSGNLQKDADFYSELGAKLIDASPVAAVLNFFGHQLVLHRVPPEAVPRDADLKMYPRHFGIIVSNRNTLIKMRRKCRRMGCIWEDLFMRKPGAVREHETLFVRDPSNNLIEFKWYRRVTM